MEDEKKNPVGRPRIPDSEKAIYQRVPIRYDTYKKLKAITKETNITFTDLIEAMLDEHHLNQK
jgi:hypothetical protein